ncbi:Microtubule-associated protein 2 like protein [Argiope bruennichi]|uniref:Microtubule-associated protein n=1 Tax=Argiope bruennichi TaxID=94029 RepID=A0A8T0FLS7_ARGBR|nr:Microtubule-associated protein 2 like protein [Argiope bruennichi]
MDDDLPSNLKREARFFDKPSISQGGDVSLMETSSMFSDSEIQRSTERLASPENLSNLAGEFSSGSVPLSSDKLLTNVHPSLSTHDHIFSNSKEVTDSRSSSEREIAYSPELEIYLPKDECGNPINVKHESLDNRPLNTFSEQSHILYDSINQNKEISHHYRDVDDPIDSRSDEFTMRNIQANESSSTMLGTINGNFISNMKNIEIQMSPVKTRIAATLGEDSVTHVDQSMEVELEGGDSDPNDPEEPADGNDNNLPVAGAISNEGSDNQNETATVSADANGSLTQSEGGDIFVEEKENETDEKEDKCESGAIGTEKEEKKIEDTTCVSGITTSGDQEDADIDEGVDVNEGVTAEFSEEAEASEVKSPETAEEGLEDDGDNLIEECSDAADAGEDKTSDKEDADGLEVEENGKIRDPSENLKNEAEGIGSTTDETNNGEIIDQECETLDSKQPKELEEEKFDEIVAHEIEAIDKIETLSESREDVEEGILKEETSDNEKGKEEQINEQTKVDETDIHEDTESLNDGEVIEATDKEKEFSTDIEREVKYHENTQEIESIPKGQKDSDQDSVNMDNLPESKVDSDEQDVENVGNETDNEICENDELISHESFEEGADKTDENNLMIDEGDKEKDEKEDNQDSNAPECEETVVCNDEAETELENSAGEAAAAEITLQETTIKQENDYSIDEHKDDGNVLEEQKINIEEDDTKIKDTETEDTGIEDRITEEKVDSKDAFEEAEDFESKAGEAEECIKDRVLEVEQEVTIEAEDSFKDTIDKVEEDSESKIDEAEKCPEDKGLEAIDDSKDTIDEAVEDTELKIDETEVSLEDKVIEAEEEKIIEEDDSKDATDEAEEGSEFKIVETEECLEDKVNETEEKRIIEIEEGSEDKTEEAEESNEPKTEKVEEYSEDKVNEVKEEGTTDVEDGSKDATDEAEESSEPQMGEEEECLEGKAYQTEEERIIKNEIGSKEETDETEESVEPRIDETEECLEDKVNESEEEKISEVADISKDALDETEEGSETKIDEIEECHEHKVNDAEENIITETENECKDASEEAEESTEDKTNQALDTSEDKDHEAEDKKVLCDDMVESKNNGDQDIQSTESDLQAESENPLETPLEEDDRTETGENAVETIDETKDEIVTDDRTETGENAVETIDETNDEIVTGEDDRTETGENAVETIDETKDENVTGEDLSESKLEENKEYEKPVDDSAASDEQIDRNIEQTDLAHQTTDVQKDFEDEALIEKDDIENKCDEAQKDESENQKSIENVEEKESIEQLSDSENAENAAQDMEDAIKEEVIEPEIQASKAVESSALPGKQGELILEKEIPSDKVCTSDANKVISPRKGIKVEEDEIETAISSVQFDDEMNEGNEAAEPIFPVKEIEENQTLCIVKDKDFEPTAELVSPNDLEIVHEQTSQDVVQDRESQEKSLNLPSPSKQTGGEEKVISEGAQTPSSISPKKRKKKRKTARSRSASQKGAASATKKTQDSKPSSLKTEKAPSRSTSSTASRNVSAAEKKIPPIKAPVGNAPPPNVKNVKSKIGSLDNVTHRPKGGDKKVESVKLEWNAKPKVGSLDYATHKPGGGDKKIITQKVDFKNVSSKVGSKDNLKHKPGGGTVKVTTEKLDFKAKAAPKIGSLDNTKHKPGGGNVVIKNEKLHFKEKAAPKIISRSGSERGSSHGGSEIGSPIPPSSPAPPENMPPLNEDENSSVQEDEKPPTATSPCNGEASSPDKSQPQDASPAISPQEDKGSEQDISPAQEKPTTNGDNEEHC